MTTTPVFPLLELLRKALWHPRHQSEPYETTYHLDRASSALVDTISRYDLQALFAASFGYTYRPKNDTSRTDTQIADELQEFLTSLSNTLHRKAIAVIALRSLAAAGYFQTDNNIRLLEGHIDLLVAPVCLPSIRKLLSEVGFQPESGGHDETIFTRGALSCSFHTASAHFFSPSTRKYYLELERYYRQSDAICHQKLGNTRWPNFPPLFLIIYLTARIQQELLAGRPSLRSYCDWLMVLHGERTALGIGEHNLETRLHELHLYRLYRALGSAAQHYFRLERNSYAALSDLTEVEYQHGEWLWQSFTNRSIPKCRPGLAYRDGLTFFRKIKCWHQLCRRCYELRHICRHEAGFAPIIWLTDTHCR